MVSKRALSKAKVADSDEEFSPKRGDCRPCCVFIGNTQGVVRLSEGSGHKLPLQICWKSLERIKCREKRLSDGTPSIGFEVLYFCTLGEGAKTSARF